MAASTVTSNSTNVNFITHQFDEVNDTLVYKYRAHAKGAPETVRFEVRDTGSMSGQTISLRICAPGQTTGYEIDTFTAGESVVVEPGGTCDIVAILTATTSGTATVSFYSGPNRG